ncbi:MAG: VUT family protein [Thermotoga sp.]|nr:queuosine precursor transporter [Thermotogota bacterium]RKX56368.1 MAG: VUT family protein [Thermotoga sp.]
MSFGYNELLWFTFIFVDLGLAVFVFRVFKREGLFALIAINSILCNIQVLKTITLFGVTATLGNILYGSTFFATDILSEIYGKKEAQKGVFIGFYSLLFMVVTMQFALWFTPAKADFANPHMKVLFGLIPRIAVASTIAYIISQSHDVWAFHMWKHKTRGHFLWMRNNFSTMVSQGIDSAVFCTIAFLGVFPMNIFWQILLTTYLFKLIIAALDTPFIYLAVHLWKGSKSLTAETQKT